MSEPQTTYLPWPDGGSWSALPLFEKIGWVFYIPCMTFIVGYNVMSFGMKPFAYAATSEKYPGMSLGWLETPCESHWLGYKGFHGVLQGEGQWVRVCLTADGWVVEIPKE